MIGYVAVGSFAKCVHGQDTRELGQYGRGHTPWNIAPSTDGNARCMPRVKCVHNDVNAVSIERLIVCGI